MDRRQWRNLYREVRIIRREAGKAAFDAMVYGSGFVRIDNDRSVHHIPIQDVRIQSPSTVAPNDAT
jgi:hypothetical protein